MATETERKFLLKNDSWRTDEHGNQRTGTPYKQGYLISSKERTVRIRIAGEKGFITIKGAAPEGTLARPEYEYQIPLSDAEELFENLCLPDRIEKTRYKIPFEGYIWEVDVFHGNNEGLIMAEVELTNEHEEVVLPSWIDTEVSHDERYFNGMLAKNPYKTWNH
jgi:CYTH domain-containing protein